MSLLQKSGWISFNPILSEFSGWIEGHDDAIPRKSNLKKRQSGEEDCSTTFASSHMYGLMYFGRFCK